MGKRHLSEVRELRDPPKEVHRAAKARQCCKIAEIRSALIGAGFVTVEEQAHVLGLPRSTSWKVLRADHKNSGLSASTIKRMLASAAVPPTARTAIQEYVHEKLLGAYGHPAVRLKAFRKQLGLPCAPCNSGERREDRAE